MWATPSKDIPPAFRSLVRFAAVLTVPLASLCWAALLVSALASISINLSVFTLPMGLPEHYTTPHMDIPKFMGVTRAAMDRFLLTIGLLSCLYLVAYVAAIPLRSRRSAVGVLALGALLCLSLLPMYPSGAGDLFHYVAQADVLLRYGANPYHSPIQAFPDHPLMPYIDYPRETMYYGPVWLGVAVLLRCLSGENLLVTLLLFKAATAASLLATAWLVYIYLDGVRPQMAVRGALLVAWNPLLLFELAGNGHNGIVMTMLVVVAFCLHQRGFRRLAITALLLATLVKYIAAALLPLFLMAMLRRAGDPRRWLAAAATYVVGASVVALPLLMVLGNEGTQGLLDKSGRMFTSSPGTVAYLWLSSSTSTGEAARTVAFYARAAFGLFYLVELYRVWLQPQTLAASSFRTILVVMMLLTFWFKPWYAAWAIPLAALAATGGYQASAIALTVGAFTIHAIMGFAWRLNLHQGDRLAINLVTNAVTWAPTLGVLALAALSSAFRGRIPAPWNRKGEDGTRPLPPVNDRAIPLPEVALAAGPATPSSHGTESL